MQVVRKVSALRKFERHTSNMKLCGCLYYAISVKNDEIISNELYREIK